MVNGKRKLAASRGGTIAKKRKTDGAVQPATASRRAAQQQPTTSTAGAQTTRAPTTGTQATRTRVTRKESKDVTIKQPSDKIASEELENLKKEIKKLNKEKNGLVKKATTAEKELEVEKKKSEDLETQLAETEKQVEDQQKELDAFKFGEEELSKMVEDQDSKIKELQKKLNDAQLLIAQLKDAVEAGKAAEHLAGVENAEYVNHRESGEQAERSGHRLADEHCKQILGLGAKGEYGYPGWFESDMGTGYSYHGRGENYNESLCCRKLLNCYNKVRAQPESNRQFSYKMISKLGEGTFGDVYEILNSRNVPFAAKIMKPNQEGSTRAELKVFRKITAEPHVNLLQLVAYERLTSNQYVFITRLMGASIKNIMQSALQYHSCRPTFAADSLKKIGLQVVNAMMHLEKLGIYHLDVKPDNILFVKGDFALVRKNTQEPEIEMKSHDVVLGDFGVARFHHERYNPGLKYQTITYRAPELFLGIGFTKTSDVWSLAATLAEMYIGKPLFRPEDKQGSPGYDYEIPNKEEQDQFECILNIVGDPMTAELLDRARSKDLSYDKIEAEYFSGKSLLSLEKHRKDRHNNRIDMFVNLLEEMFILDERKRPSFENVRNHQFFKD